MRLTLTNLNLCLLKDLVPAIILLIQEQNLLLQQEYEQPWLTKTTFQGLLPDNCLNIIKNHTTIEYNDFSTVLGSKLLSMDTLDHIEGINQDLSNRIANNKYNFTDIETFIPYAKSKDTYSAISKAFTAHIILDIKTDDIKEFVNNNYAMILGFTKKSGVLSEISKSTKNTAGKLQFATFFIKG